MRTVILIASQLLSSGAMAADVFKCADEAGTATYQDKPCQDGGGEQMKLEEGPAMSSRQIQLIELANRGRVAAGMSSDQVRIAWGAPTSINRSVRSNGISEQWVYRSGPGSAQYVYFDDGFVSSFQN
jgi:hypothetical protein